MPATVDFFFTFASEDFIGNVTAMSRLRRVSQFLTALLRGAWWACHGGNRQECWERARGLALVRRALTGHREVPFALYLHRLRACHACPIYDRQRRTCGTPGDGEKTYANDAGRIRPMGCWCWMPLKARLTDATCWMSDMTGRPTWGWAP